MTREEALAIVREFVKNEGLVRHMLCVEAAMRFYAEKYGEDVETWGLLGLLHDFDWEIHPGLDEHPMAGAPLLRADGWDEETIRVILSHYSEGTGVERQKPVDFALLACDEITGLIIAATLVKPSRNIAETSVASIQKKWKDRRFAAGVDREHVAEVTADFSRACFDGGLELWTHVGNVLSAMQAAAAELELDGRLAIANAHE